MDSKKPALVPSQTWPSNEATDAEKQTEKFGLRIGQAIQHEWFRQDGGKCRYYDRWNDFYRLRLYSRGQQPIGQYKKQMAVNGDLSKLNLDWTPVPVMEKFVDIVVNGMADRMFTPKAYSQDAASAEKRNSYQQNIEKDMIAEPLLTQTKEEFGINVFNVPKEDLPENDQELQLHMQLKYKPAIEIAEETAISTVLDMNDFHETKWRFDYDITTIGIGVVRHRYSHDEGIKIDYVDPANTVYSYTEDPYFKDVFYWGEVKSVPILELKKINPNLTNEDIAEIRSLGTSWNSQYSVHNPNQNSLFNNDVVSLLYFNYKTDKKYIYKNKRLSNGGERVIRRDESFMPPLEDEAPFERLEKRIDVWMDGVMILGTSYMLKWETMENMVKPDAAFQKVSPNYIAVAPRVFKGNIRSLADRMISATDRIQLTHLKMQQVQSKLVPDGVFLDADGLADIKFGDGGEYTPQKALDMYFSTGSVIGRSYTGEGEYNQAKVPIQQLNSSSGQSKMAALINVYNFHMNMIRDLTGLNPARDASTPDKDALVGIQKLAALNSNVATRHILDAGLYMMKKLSESISIRISDVLEYSEDKEEFSNQIGKYNVAMLEDIKNLPISSFGISIEISPDEEQKAQLENNISIALREKEISLSDAIDIRLIRNMKTANELLKLRQKQKNTTDQKREQQKMEMQAAVNNQSAQSAAQASIAKTQEEAKAKIAIENSKTEGEMRLESHKFTLKTELMKQEFGYQKELTTLASMEVSRRDSTKDDRKDKRLDQQSTNQSTLISQRTNKALPVNFNSTEADLDTIGASEFL